MEVEMEISESSPMVRENAVDLMADAPEVYGEGLPYAPGNWPEAGDVWSWKVGKRVINGYYRDRYLYLPLRLRQPKKPYSFPSKLAVERYLQATFPDVDVKAFFDSFSWRIPAKKSPLSGNGSYLHFPLPSEEAEEYTERPSDGTRCKAGNKMCNSLEMIGFNSPLLANPCDLCCTDPRFCHDCCCFICYKIVSPKHGGYSYIRCESIVSDGYICGHFAHVDCALRTYMAGTVGGSIDLDAEYHCMLCDERKDLIPHVTMLFATSKGIDSSNQVERVLNVGLRILNGTRRNEGKQLLSQIELAIQKLKSGTTLEEMWKEVENMSRTTPGKSSNENFLFKVENCELPVNNISSQSSLTVFPDYKSESLKLKDEIYQVLQELQKSQESEYRIAVEMLPCSEGFYSAPVSGT